MPPLPYTTGLSLATQAFIDRTIRKSEIFDRVFNKSATAYGCCGMTRAGSRYFEIAF